MHVEPSIRRWTRLAAACLLVAVSALTAATLDVTAATAATPSLPCDIYATGGTPCVTAHSTTRALFAAYNGPLYQIQRSSDSGFLTISVRAAGGVANAAPQVSFCAGTTCTITMNAIYWGQACWTGGCTGNGPWVGCDLENGMYFSAAGPNSPSFTGTHLPFVSAWEKNNGTTNFTLKVGDATTGSLSTTYSGALPGGYAPMKVQPSILLGTGGDNSDGDIGEFFEGAVTAGFPTDTTENAVQASLATAGYSGNATLFPTTESVISLRAHANSSTWTRPATAPTR